MISIPDGWVVAPLAEVADFAAGRTPARANAAYWDNGEKNVPWVAISDMQNYGTVTGTAETISERAYDEVFGGQAVPAGTLLMSFKLTIGRVARLGMPACHNEAIIALHPRKGIDSRYLGYFLSQVDFSGHQDRQIMGNTLNRAKLERLEVAHPVDEEQQKSIADILDAARKAADTHEATHRVSTSLREATMEGLFTRGLRGEAVVDGGVWQQPKSWVTQPVDAHFAVGTGGTPSRAVANYWDGGTIPWVKTGEVNYSVITQTSEHITPAALKDGKTRLFPPGTLLMAMYGQGVTRAKVALLGVEAACNQACAAMTPLDDVVDVKYLYYFLAWQYEAIRELAHGGQQQNLNLEIVRRLPISYPPDTDEQREIVEILEAIDLKASIHRGAQAAADGLFEALLRGLMQGEVAADDLNLDVLQSEGRL